jgi:hypothetical protein
MSWLYGRQWTPPLAGDAFHPQLLESDEAAISGKPRKAVDGYMSLATNSHIAKRRISLAKRQARLNIEDTGDELSLRTVRIAFIDWFREFKEADNILTRILDEAQLNYRVTDIASSDILIAGCYGSLLEKTPKIAENKLVLFVSGENLNPTYSIHDYSLSTLPMSFCGKNCRLPQWMGELDFHNSRYSWAQANTSDYALPLTRDIPISAVYNNSTPLRDQIIAELRQYFGQRSVQVFGSHRGKEINKYEILSRSVINVCFENSLGEGYVTEKLLHSLMQGCSSLYWGDHWYKKDFNPRDTFNLYEEQSTDSLIKWCENQLEKRIPPSNGLTRFNNELFGGSLDLHPIIAHLRKVFQLVLNLRLL